MVLLDIACTTLEDAQQAQQGGANSLELSFNLALDGLTPTLAFVQTVRQHVQIPLHVMLRAHAHNFVYNHAEKAAMLADSRAIAPFCDGFIVGGLLDDQAFDVAWVHVLAEVFPLHRLTLHRALDYANNADKTLEALQGIAHRVLASGSYTTAWDGRETLHHWVQRFGSQYSFVAAGRVNHETIAALVADTGVHECHAARAVRREGVVAADLVHDLRKRTL